MTALMILAASSLVLSDSGDGPPRALLDDYSVCGETSLYVIARLKQVNTTLERIREIMGPRQGDLRSLEEIARAAEKIGLRPVVASMRESSLNDIPLPAVAHLRRALHVDTKEQGHFVVVLALGQKGILVLDPPFPSARISWPRFESVWTGNVIFFLDSDESLDVWKGNLRSQEKVVALAWTLMLTIGFFFVAMLMISRWPLSVVAGLLLFWSVFAYTDYASIGPPRNPGMRAAAAYILANRCKAEPVVAETPFEFFRLAYYLRDSCRPVLCVKQPCREKQYGAAHLLDSDLATAEEILRHKPQRLWIVTSAPYHAKAETELLKAGECEVLQERTFEQDFWLERPLRVKYCEVKEESAFQVAVGKRARRFGDGDWARTRDRCAACLSFGSVKRSEK